MKMWVVGLVLDPEYYWALLGVFSDKEKAIASCTSSDHFIGPYTLDESMPIKAEPWPGAWYPLLEAEPV